MSEIKLDFELKRQQHYSTACPSCGQRRKKSNKHSLVVHRDSDGFIRVKCYHPDPECSFQEWKKFKDEEQISGTVSFNEPKSSIEIKLPIPDYVEVPTTWGEHHLHWYKDMEGNPLFAVIRYQHKDGTKSFAPLVFLKTGEWAAGSNARYPEGKFLFGAENIKNNKKILIVEGEKSAEAGQKLLGHQMAVVTWRGGANNITSGAWHLLKNKEIFLWPDNDEAGHKAMNEIKLLLPVEKVKILRVDHLPAKADIADDITPADIRKAFEDGRIEETGWKGPFSFQQMLEQHQFLNKTLKTGYPIFDREVRFPTSGFSVIEGRSGHGKSAFAINLADNWLKFGRRVVIFSYEIPASRVLARFVRRNDPQLKIDDVFDEKNIPEYLKTAIETGQLEIFDQGHQMSAQELTTQLNSPDYNGALVIIDYLQIVPFRNQFGEKHKIIKELLVDPIRTAANKYGFIVLGLSQLTPNYSSPELDSPRECRDIHFSAEMVVRIWNREYFAEHPVYDFLIGNYAVHVLKNRDGHANMVFDCHLDMGAKVEINGLMTPKDVMIALRQAKSERKKQGNKISKGDIEHDDF